MKLKIIFILQCILLSACVNEIEHADELIETGYDKQLTLVAKGMDLIESRAPGQEADNDSRIDHVIIVGFDQTGGKVFSFQQSLENYSRVEGGNVYYNLHLLLKGAGSDMTLCAICNYPDFWKKVESATEPLTLDGVKEFMVDQRKKSDIDAAFPGYMIMYGDIVVPKADLEDKKKALTIPVTRIAAKVSLTVQFQPEDSNDQFFLSAVEVHNVPLCSYLKGRADISPETGQTSIAANNGDAVHYDFTPNEKLPGEPEIPAIRNDEKKYYIENAKINFQEDGSSYTARFYLFENRRGRKRKDYYSGVYTDPVSYQFLKGRVGRMEYPFASYLLIKGIYTSGVGTHKFTQDVKFYVYIGEDNFSDFNVKRNAHYRITATVKAIDDLDTRVNATILNECTISPFFDNPLDAHYGVGRCFAYTENNDWELYVEEPDKHPWLEISFSERYRPHLIGEQIKPDDKEKYAGTYFEGTSALSTYFYIHVDEYIPSNPEAKESENIKNGVNIALDENQWRTAAIVLHDKVNDTKKRLEIKQRPAQLVKMEVKNVLGNVVRINEFYVEYELESKDIQWGFLQYPANPVMTSMINDRWDGLANTRRLYKEAVKSKGAYNNSSLPPFHDFPTSEEAAANLPESDLIGYVMTKNRDNNGNGCIDYDEIKWYVPALDELMELWRVVGDGHLTFEDPDARFHSSTPYLAGYTYEVPGRAFYVKTEKGKKRTAFTMRDRRYNVICCRRKNAWPGEPDGEVDGDVTVDPDWNPEEDNVLPVH